MSASALTLVKKYWWEQLFESTAFIIIRTSVHDKFYFVQFRKVPTTNYQYERKTLTSEEFAFGNLSITLVLKYDISITSDKVTNQITLPKGRIQRNAMNNRAVWAFSWEADQGNQSGTLVGIRHNFQNNKKKTLDKIKYWTDETSPIRLPDGIWFDSVEWADRTHNVNDRGAHCTFNVSADRVRFWTGCGRASTSDLEKLIANEIINQNQRIALPIVNYPNPNWWK